MPTSTDLVTDLPADFAVFGQAVATSMADLLGGTTGQVLSKASNTDMDFTWVAQDDSNAIQNAIVDAKGDLIAASAADTPARLAVGNNGETLVADSSTSTGLRYQGNFAAGKNKIINGDFGIWQRGTTFSSSGAYTSDRWQLNFNGSGATRAVTRQTFTAGTAPVAGYEGTYFLRYDQSVAGTGGGYNQVFQPVEDVRTFAGQTVTFSFWAKASATVTLPYLAFEQVFGSGGSGDVGTTLSTTTSLTTSWTRYSFTATVPSISGKTIGTNSYLKVILGVPTNSTFTIDFWGVQLEASNTATAFQTATGTLQGELAACQRYYTKSYNLDIVPGTATNYLGGLQQQTPNVINFGIMGYITFPSKMRTSPTVTFYSRQSGTAGIVDNLAGADHAANSGIALSAGQNGVTIQNQSGGTLTVSYNGVGFHYVASAEL
jgi:hypothetical protein